MQNVTTPILNSLRERSLLSRAAIIAAVLALSALLAYRTPEGWTARILIGLPVATLAAAFLVRKPGLGVIMVAIAGLVVPFSIGTGTNTTLNPVILLVPVLTGIWLADMIVRQRSIQLRHHLAVYLALALATVAVLAFIAGQLPWYSIPGVGTAAQLGGLVVFLLSMAAFLLSAHTLDERRLKQLVAAFLIVGAIFLVARVLPPLWPVTRLYERGALGSVFWIWLAALAAGMALFYKGLPTQARVMLAGLATMTLLVGYVVNGEWASGWAPPLLALLLLLWLRFPRWGWIVLFVVALLFFANFERFWYLATDNEAWLARRQAWQIVLDIARVNPILGLGPSNYYSFVQQADIAGWGGVWNVRFSSHNNWVDIIAQTGILGLLLFLGFVLTMGRIGLRLVRTQPDGFARAFAAACLAGLVATLVSGMLGDWFLPFVYNIGLDGMRSSILFWIFLGGLLTLEFIYGPSSTRIRPAATK